MENEEDWRKNKWGGKEEEMETWDNEVDEEKKKKKREWQRRTCRGKRRRRRKKKKSNEKLKVKGVENGWRWKKEKEK